MNIVLIYGINFFKQLCFLISLFENLSIFNRGLLLYNVVLVSAIYQH